MAPKKKDKKDKRPGVPDGYEDHWAAPFYTFLPARVEDMDQKCRDRITLIQIDADRKLLQLIGPRKKEYPRLIATAQKVIASDSVSTVQKIGASVILDYCDEGWRGKVSLGVLGGVITRNDPLVFEWRKAVLTRDGFACTLCGSENSLQAHHIVRWVDMPEARLLLENGVTLCISCHYKAHGKVYGG